MEEYLKNEDDDTVDITIRIEYNQIETDHAMFIDDLTVLIYTTKSKEGIKAAQHVVNKIYKYFKDNNLKLNTDKTQILCLRKKNETLPDTHIKDANGNDLAYVTDVSLLGIQWNEHYNNDKLLDSIIAKARRAFFMLQRCIQSNNLEIHLLAYKSIILGIIQYSAGVLASMTATQRKKLEKCQRNMINWIYRGCNTDQGEINNVTIDLAKADFNENEESNDVTNEINYKEKLSKLQLNPLSHRIDRNLILLGADALFDRLAIPQITMKESKTTERFGLFIQTKVKKETKRPPFF